MIEENKQALVAMSHKSFQGIVATVEKVNIGLRIVGPRVTYKETFCHWETVCLLEVPQQTIGDIFLWSARRYQTGKKIKI